MKFNPTIFANKYKNEIKQEIENALDSRKDAPKMYEMMRYFLGWRDESLNELEGYGGKQFRATLALYIAEAISGDYKKALPVASSVEIFHNFTLIHDDIQDGDSLRRGRKTVWSIWGVPQGINVGDAQSILALKPLENLDLTAEKVLKIKSFLEDKFLEVIEGQFLDVSFEDLEISAISIEDYLRMIQKKTSVLVGAATKGAALTVTDKDAVFKSAYEFGLNFGLAYQICDDLQSIWGTKDKTGKEELKDIADKKKTLPIIFAFQKSGPKEQMRLKEIYSKEISVSLTKEVVEILDKVNSYEFCRQEVEKYKQKSIESLRQLGENSIISELEEMVNFLTPDIRKEEV